MLPTEQTTKSEVVTLPADVEALVAAPGRDLARPMVNFLKAQGINIQLASDADSAFEEALLHRPSVVLVDDRIPPAGGIELCQRLKSNTRTHFVPTILVAVSDVRQHRLRALAAGADAIFFPSTDDQERKTRLWALLRTQAIYRRQERKQRSQGSAIEDRRRWIGAFVHDLQSSVTALQANFEYLAQGAQTSAGGQLPTAVDECLRDSRTVFSQMARGLRTVLDFERFEGGRLALRNVPLTLASLAGDVMRELDWQARAAGKEISVTSEADPPSLMGDPELLRQALISLSAHTLRQSANRRLQIKTWSDNGHSLVSIAGDGAHMDTADRARIFEPYSASGDHAPVAHGLGLALAKIAVEMHGGRIWVDDAVPGGTAFVIELKGAAPATAWNTPTASHTLSNTPAE